MNKSSSLLLHLHLHLHLHLLHFLIMKKSSYFKKKKIYIYIYQFFVNLSKKKKKEKEIFKKCLGTRGIGLVLLRLLPKKKKKNHQSKFSNSFKNSRFPNFSKKKKKIQNFQFLRKIQVFEIQKKKKNLH